MPLKSSTKFPFFRGNVQAKVPTLTFSGKSGDSPTLSINPYTGFGPGVGGVGLSAQDIAANNWSGAQVLDTDQIAGWIEPGDLNTYNPAVSTTRLENKQTAGPALGYPDDLDLIMSGGAAFTGSAGSANSNTYINFATPGQLQSPTPTTTIFKNCGIDGTLEFGLYLTTSGQGFQHIFDSRTTSNSTGITIAWFPGSSLLRITIAKKTGAALISYASVVTPPVNTPFLLTVVGYYSLAAASAGWPADLTGDDVANTNGSEFPVMVYINGSRQTLADSSTGTLFTDHISVTAGAGNTAASRFTLGARVDTSGNPLQQLDGGSRIYFWRYYSSEILTEAGVVTNYQASRGRLGI